MVSGHNDGAPSELGLRESYDLLEPSPRERPLSSYSRFFFSSIFLILSFASSISLPATSLTLRPPDPFGPPFDLRPRVESLS